MRMEDPVRPTTKQFHETYDTAFRVWANLHLHAVENPTLPASCLSVQDAFRDHPYFPPLPRLKSVQPAQSAGQPRLYATGYSSWGSPPCKDGFDFSSFRQKLEIEVAVISPVTISMAEPGQDDLSNPPWFVRSDKNYIPILILAWAYVLSARWTELFAEGGSMSYTESQAEHQDALPEQSPDQSATFVDIGAATAEEVRWWAAVLAPGQGWQSTLNGGQHISPWSVRLESGQKFRLPATSQSSASPFHTLAVSFSAAMQFLNQFCHRHNIIDQSHAALAAVLLFPTFSRSKVVRLSQPRLNDESQLSERVVCRNILPSVNGQSRLHHDWVLDEHHLDRLLALSCNVRGIRPMLFSAFYEPKVDCNLVSPWLQGTVAAIDSVSHEKPHVLGRMLIEREPSAAFLWVGATILRLQESLLQEVRRGQIPADLHSAVWSGTTQIFLQQAVSSPLVVDGCISRADEARLLFLSQAGQHSRVPVCQWRPFGVTPSKDVDLEVRIHENCENHWLQYRGFSWDCVEAESQLQLPRSGAKSRPAMNRPDAENDTGGRSILVLHDGLNTEKDVVSENATRSIFGWLRSDGWAQHEKDLRSHEWFDVFDSDEEEEDLGRDDESASQPEQSSMPIRTWLSSIDGAAIILEEESSVMKPGPAARAPRRASTI